MGDSELLAQIARARNLSQGVEATALQNLAGKFEVMKDVLKNAQPAPPFGSQLIDRVLWKTNQEVPEDSQGVPVKLLIHILALMNTRSFPPATKIANEVYMRSGIIIREFGEAEGEDERFYEALTRLLPEFIRLYDHIYAALPEIDPAYPWADGKFENEKKRRRGVATTPILARPCASKVLSAFVWPIFSAFRLLLKEREDGTLHFRLDPIALFEDMKNTLIAGVQSFHQNQAHGVVAQLGKDKEVWLRLQAQIDTELVVRDRLGTAGSQSKTVGEITCTQVLDRVGHRPAEHVVPEKDDEALVAIQASPAHSGRGDAAAVESPSSPSVAARTSGDLRILPIRVTEGMIKQDLLTLAEHVNVRRIAIGEILTVKTELGDQFRTDVVLDKKLRERGAIRRFYRDASVMPGDWIVLTEINRGQWELRRGKKDEFGHAPGAHRAPSGRGRRSSRVIDASAFE